ncbi:MAG: translation initiation factor IF-2 N-terminal domain-containing protein, partial [Oscillospiraceae bacterium]|nr:translation initiation factor IF-2 N-terminal domain-containing protein [Oscillospiraceae bacterium]
MAANVQKYKVANMAKDLDKKTKEIVEVLKEKGFDGKTSSSVLEGFEINIVLEHYASASTVEDINAYLSSKKPEERAAEAPKTEEKPVKEEKAEKKAEPAAVRENKEEPKAEEPAKKDVKAEEKPVKEEKAAPVKKQEEAPKAEAQHEAKKEFSQNRPQNAGRPQQGAPYDRKPQNADGNRPASGERKPFEKRPFEGRNDGKKPYTPGQNGGQFDRKPQNGGQLSDRQFEKQISKINREGAQLLKQEGIKAEPYPKFDKNDKFDKYSNVKFTKDGFVSEAPQGNQQKPKPKFQKPGNNQFGRGGVDKDEENQSVRQPSLKPVFDKDGRIKSRYAGERIEGATPTADDDGRVRIVDMRTSEVDLSKYDERLDTLADTFDDEGSSKGGKKKSGAGNNQNKNGKGGKDSFSRDAAFTPVAN